MLGSIYVGLSGMDAYSKGLQTISNNVANMNTNGYKSASVSFSDFYSVGGGGLTYMGSDRHGSGNGVTVQPPLLQFTSGELRDSANDLDLAIKGSGFLVLLDNGTTYYTRTGQFAVGTDGYISQQDTGYRLAVLDASNKPVAVNVDTKRTYAPAATTKVVFSDNLSSSATTASVTDIAVYDSRGGKHIWTVTFTKDTSGSVTDQWAVDVKNESGAAVGSSGTLHFIGSIADPSADTITITDTPTGADPLSVVLDFSSGVTSYSGGTSSTLRASKVDGNAVGNLTTVGVDTDGQIKLTYSNEKSSSLGYVAIADFRDPQQLQESGGGLFKNTDDGEMRLLQSGKDGIGSLVSKKLEGSNVNLADEFGQLILVQRGFQACSQVLSVSNDMIQQLFGIRGQQ
jgi:flagellar hook protein FlgE